jgi:hypothetical protein
VPDGFFDSFYRVDHIESDWKDKGNEADRRERKGKDTGSMSGVIAERGTEYRSGRLNRSHVSLT